MFLASRFAKWALDSDKVRQQDVRNHFRYYANTPLGRMIALDFLLTNWNEINDRWLVFRKVHEYVFFKPIKPIKPMVYLHNIFQSG